MSKSFGLQQAVYGALNGKIVVATVSAAVAVYDAVPDSAASADAPDEAFPYVAIGDGQALPDDVSAEDDEAGDDGESESIDLHVWSRYRGRREVKLIMEAVKALLHLKSLPVPGRASAHCVVRRRTDFLDPDGKTRHGVVAVEIVHRN